MEMEKDQQVSHHSLEGWQGGLQSAFEQAAIGMAHVGLDGRWLRINPARRQIVGYSEEQLLATDFPSITHPDDLDADLNNVHRMLTREIRSYQMEKRYFHNEGHVVWVLLSVTLVCDASNIVENLTEWRELERQLRQAQKIQAVGRVVGGIAHDFNN